MMRKQLSMSNRLDRASAVSRLFAVVSAIFLIAGSSAFAANQQFSFATVVDMARDLAGKPYQAPKEVEEPLRSLSYDDWRKIRFIPAKSLWRDAKLPFELQFFPPGFLYDRTVSINIVDGTKATPLAVTADMFDFSQNGRLKEKVPAELGAAGFRVHAVVNSPTYMDEFLVFLGASYFRAVAKNQGYGLSARGLSVDTAEQKGEEFPWFREFWIQKPGKKDKQLTLFALLDSESMTGAYVFKVTPGEETVVDVTSRIFLRKPVTVLGIAPLTSMFLYGENSLSNQRMDWRPEVHDSDGLLLHLRSGEWLWRPLRNPVPLRVHTFQADDVLGFGLMQRDTDFRSYQDLESRYEKRPSLWIEPHGDWGPGEVKLVLIPTDKEIHDNIAAFWRPKDQGEPGKPLSFDYRMRWLTAPGTLSPHILVTDTRVARQAPNAQFFVLDFSADKSAKPRTDTPQGMVSAGAGVKIEDQQVYRNAVTGGWRLAFKAVTEETAPLASMMPEKTGPVELRAFLRFGDGAVSETWSYDLTREK
ncbi:MAG: glucan biosynthesis protein G [Acidobacteriota bacterium]